MAMMMMERPRTRVVEKKTTSTIEPEKQDQFYYRLGLKNIRENDRHFGEHEMTRNLPNRGNRKPPRIAICLDRNYGEHEIEVHDWDTTSSEEESTEEYTKEKSTENFLDWSSAMDESLQKLREKWASIAKERLLASSPKVKSPILAKLETFSQEKSIPEIIVTFHDVRKDSTQNFYANNYHDFMRFNQFDVKFEPDHFDMFRPHFDMSSYNIAVAVDKTKPRLKIRPHFGTAFPLAWKIWRNSSYITIHDNRINFDSAQYHNDLMKNQQQQQLQQQQQQKQEQQRQQHHQQQQEVIPLPIICSCKMKKKNKKNKVLKFFLSCASCA